MKEGAEEWLRKPEAAWFVEALGGERSRLNRIARTESLRTVTACACALGIVLAGAIFFVPGFPATLAKSLLFCGALAVGFAALLNQPRKPRLGELAASLDKSRGLPDSAVSALSLGGGAWGDAILSDARSRFLKSVEPGFAGRKAAFPAGVAACVLLAGAFALPGGGRGNRADSPSGLAEAFAGLKADWDGDRTEDPASEVLREAAGLLRPEATNSADVFLSAASAEARIAEARDRLGAQAAKARELASAFRGILPAVSEALSKGDFSAAAQAAAAGAALPDAAPFPESAKSSLEELARQLEAAGLPGLAKAVRGLASSKSLAERAEAMRNLSEAMEQSAKSMAAADRLSRALMRLAGAREEAAGEGVPIADTSEDDPGDAPPGTGAGSSPNRAAAAENPDIFAPKTSAAIPGTMNPEGETSVETLLSTAGPGAAARAPARQVKPADYELARQAVADESLPVSRRNTVKKYFETLRAAQ